MSLQSVNIFLCCGMTSDGGQVNLVLITQFQVDFKLALSNSILSGCIVPGVVGNKSVCKSKSSSLSSSPSTHS